MRRAAIAVAGSLLLFGITPVTHAQEAASARRSTPELIERAVGRGEVGRGRADLLLAYALARPDRLPERYRGSVPWDGTLPLLHLRERLAAAPPSPERDAAQEVLAASIASCDGGFTVTNSLPSAHFYMEYGTIAAPLDANGYSTSLETAWTKEVDTFGWAAPPVAPSPAPNDKYHVIVGDLGPNLYGYVSSGGDHAGLVGNNPNTSWNDVDAYASCMVLNEDYTTFPSLPQASLDSTTAHEFNHSLQFGYGGLTGSNVPDPAFTEGGATWMEDEVFDAANDNYNYLWPTFTQSMGVYTASPYPYWITFRGLTERYGTGTGQGGEQVMQDFWELTSKGTGNNLSAMQAALVNRGTTLGEAYHAYAIAVKFNKACTGDYVLPHCFEEGPGYVTEASPTVVDGAIASVPGSVSTLNVRDNYALRWVGLPTSGGPYDVTLANDSVAGGLLRGSVVCDTGTGLEVIGFPQVVDFDDAPTLAEGFDPTGCTSVVAVVSNESQTSPNPSGSTARLFTVSTAAPGSNVTLSISRIGEGTGTVTSDVGGISCGSTCSGTVASATTVTLMPTADDGSDFFGWSGAGCSGTGSCVVSPTEATEVRAQFDLESRNLTTTTSGAGSGTVTSAPAGISCGVDCDEIYEFGTAVRLQAVPDPDSAFGGWSGGGCSGTGPCIVVLDDNETVDASFVGVADLTVATNGNGMGTVTSSPSGISCGVACSAAFADGTVVTLSPSAGTNSGFTGWGGACSGTGACAVTMSADRSVTATFVSPPLPTEGPDTATLDGTGDYAALGGDDVLTIDVPASSAGRTFTVNGGAGKDTITVRFDPGAMGVTLRVLGGSGNDRVTVLSSLPAGSTLSVGGGGGKDTLDGAGSGERLAGGGGADTIRARGGRDRLLGGSGRDNLYGGGGSDRLNGGASSDRCRGGAGSDVLISCER